MPKGLKTVKSKRPSTNWWATFWNFAWHGPFYRKIVTVVALIVFICGSVIYGVGQWYIDKHSHEPLVLGTTFIPDYAQYFGLDPHATLQAILGDLGMKQVRLVSYWSDIEKNPGQYDFSELDREFALANQYHAKVSLAIGIRQPRWPECHEPSWIDDSKPESQWTPQLDKFMTAVINRYKNNPALESYQLENEFFMKVFGQCHNFDRNRLVAEFNMVKQDDPSHPIIVSRSDNWIGIPVGKPTPDEFGISVYKRVWDAAFTHRYFEYPLPAHFYAFLAGAEELWSGRNMMIHELQAEPWTPNGLQITQTSVAEQYKSMNPQRMQSRIAYGEGTGMRTIELWGAEWWYWLKVDKNDPDVWNVVKQAVAQANTQNQQLAAQK